MKKRMKYVSGAVLLLAGVSTVTLFQNCSAGSLPAGLEQTSTSSSVSTGVTVAAAAPLPLGLNAASTSVATSGSVVLTPNGGTAPYTYTATCGGVTADPVAGTFFVAPSTVPASGSCVIKVTDASQLMATTTVSVVAPAATTPTTTTPTTPTVTAVSKIIYRFFNASIAQHLFADSTSVNEGGNLEGPVYRLMSDATSGGVPFYRCRGVVEGSLVQYMSTTAANCEGLPNATPVATIGYIYTSSTVPNTQPLYRFHVTFQAVAAGETWYTNVQDHLEQTSSNLPAAGWVSDGVIGYVPTN